jgi:glyoxylase I family protein
MRVTRILHSSVNVTGSLDPSSDFYRDVLGLDLAPRPEIPGVGGAWLEVGDAQIHLVDAAPGDDPIRPTDHHVCLGVDDLEAAIAELAAAGVAFVTARQGAVVQVFVADPSGNTIELQQDHV